MIDANETTHTKDDLMAIEKTVSRILAQHIRMENYFSWKAPKDFAERKKYSEDNSLSEQFVYDGRKVDLKCETHCSGERIFYKGKFSISGKSVTIRAVRKLWWEIRECLGYENRHYNKDWELFIVTKETPAPYY